MAAETLIIIPGAVGYAGVWLYTYRHSYQERRKLWMDKKIREQRAWEAGRPQSDKRVSKSQGELLAKVHDSWLRKGTEDASTDAFFAGMLWPVYWPLQWVHHRPAPSAEEKVLMDQAAYERLRELERQAGLTPLDELEAPEGRKTPEGPDGH